MKNPAIAIECAKCAVPVRPVLHPKPATLMACPKCGSEEPYHAVWEGCMAEIAARLRGVATDDARWRFRAGPPPVASNGDPIA